MKQFKCPKRKCSGKINVGSTICPECGKNFGVFGKRGSDALVKKYCEKKYQGQSPRDAKVVFIGRDANFAANLSESTYIFDILLDYLDDGVKFWENSDDPTYWEHRTNSDLIRKVHHPFLLPAYRQLPNKDGYTYHYNFSRLELDSRYAQCISFVEVISVPTKGYHRNDPDDQIRLLTNGSEQHITDIETDILSGDKKVVFISDMAIHALGDFDKLSEFYQLIYKKKYESSKGIPKLHSSGNVSIHKCYHFSDPRAKTKEHTDSLVKLINNYCNLTSGSTADRD